MARPEATAEEPPSGSPPAEKKPEGASSLLPILLAVVIAPALTWAIAQFVLIPQLKKELQTGVAPAARSPAPGREEGHGKGKASSGYTFENIVVNLAGTMGTRYLKTTFLVTGSDAGLQAAFEGNRAQLVDITLNVLSSLTLSDLEEAGAKNILREKLIHAYNQALGRKVAEQLFFSDFVVQ